MKKTLLSLLITALLFTLCSCGFFFGSSGETNITPDPTGSPSSETNQQINAEQYLEETSNEDIFQFFVKATYVGSGENFGFDSPENIMTDDLFRFSLLAASEDVSDSWYDKQDQKYHISVTDITNILDFYFEKYSFTPEELSFAEYDKQSDTFEATEATAIGVDGGGGKCTLHSAEAIDSETVQVKIISRFYDEFTKESSETVIEIKGKITKDGVKLLSCAIQP